jgi:uncharacterized membrane protein
MATVSQSLQDRSRNWSRITLWTIVILMMGYVIYHNERFLINSADPVWQHYQPFKWWLLPHGLAGACALFLGPMQFSDRLRQRYLKLHKTVGWIYVVGAMIVAPFGAYIQYFEERMQQPRSFTMAAASDAGLLMLTTAIALFFVLRGNIQQHRQWMTRSYAVALVFLEVRVISGVFGFDNSPMATEVIVWMCVICSVPIADIVLNWREFKRGKITQQKAAAAKAA